MADNLSGEALEKFIFDKVWNSKTIGGNIHDGLPAPPAPKKTRWQSFLSACESKTVNDVMSKASLFLVPAIMAACITAAVLIPPVGIPLTLAATVGIGLGGAALLHNRKFWLRWKSSADWTDRLLSLHKGKVMTHSDTEAGLKLLEHLPLGEDPYSMVYGHGMHGLHPHQGAAVEKGQAPEEASKAAVEKDPEPPKAPVDVKVPAPEPPTITPEQLAAALKAFTPAPKPVEAPKARTLVQQTPVARGCSGPYPAQRTRPCVSSIVVR